jgi:hypothetical protein
VRYLRVVGAKIDERTYQRIEELAKKLELNKSELIRIFIEIGTAVLEKGDYSDRRIVISAPVNVTVNTGRKMRIDREAMSTLKELSEWLERVASKATDYPIGLKNVAARSLLVLSKILQEAELDHSTNSSE